MRAFLIVFIAALVVFLLVIAVGIAVVVVEGTPLLECAGKYLESLWDESEAKR